MKKQRYYEKLISILGTMGVILFGKILENILSFYNNYFGNNSGYFLLAISLILLFIFAIIQLFKWLMARSRKKSWIEYKEATPVKALIAAVSMGDRETPAETAIKFHESKLEHCWLLVTNQANANYEKIYKKYAEQDPDSENNHNSFKIYKCAIEDPYEIENIFEEMKDIYQKAAKMGIKKDEILCDYTGATATISAAMIMATAFSENRNLQYLKPNKVDENGRPIIEEGTTPQLIDFVMPVE